MEMLCEIHPLHEWRGLLSQLVKGEKKIFPSYRQLPNGCGLNTFLMLINPDKNQQFKAFLNDNYDNLTHLTKYIKEEYTRLKEFRWAIMLNYLLLKILGNNLLSHYLNRLYRDEFENYKLISLYNLKKNFERKLRSLPLTESKMLEHNFEHNIIDPYLCTANLYEMRTNLDLKMLFSVFGGAALSNHQFNIDGTGAIFFEEQDLQEDPNGFNEKIQFLTDHLNSTREHEVYCIAINSGYHWTPLTSIKNISNRYHSRSYRFYLFKYSINKALITKSNISKWFRSEIQKEKYIISHNQL